MILLELNGCLVGVCLVASLDPTMRTWLNDSRNYMEPVKIGDVMRGSGIGVVVEAGPGSRFKIGVTVNGLIGRCSIRSLLVGVD